MDSRNTHEKKILTHEIPVRKNFGPTNTHDGTMALNPRDPRQHATLEI